MKSQYRCELCNVEINDWNKHINTKSHIKKHNSERNPGSRFDIRLSRLLYCYENMFYGFPSIKIDKCEYRTKGRR